MYNKVTKKDLKKIERAKAEAKEMARWQAKWVELLETENIRNPILKTPKLYLEDLKELVKTGNIRIAIHEGRANLRWIKEEKTLDFWKTDLIDHLFTESAPLREDYRDNYFYFASEWLLEDGKTLILLQKNH